MIVDDTYKQGFTCLNWQKRNCRHANILIVNFYFLDQDFFSFTNTIKGYTHNFFSSMFEDKLHQTYLLLDQLEFPKLFLFMKYHNKRNNMSEISQKSTFYTHSSISHEKYDLHPSIHPFSSAYPVSGRGG